MAPTVHGANHLVTDPAMEPAVESLANRLYL